MHQAFDHDEDEAAMSHADAQGMGSGGDLTPDVRHERP